MNLPSLDKYENDAVSGATIIVDSTLIARKVERTDLNVFYIPATRLAKDMGAPTLANMIMLGKMIKESGAVSMDNLEDAMKKVVPPKKADLIGINLKAVQIGYDY
jgi:2-oxoglutarate ferredoxin oxidoreductase subunit gamma